MEERNKKSLTRTAKTDFQTRDEKEAGKVIEGYFAVFYWKNSIDFSVSFYNYHEPSIYPCLSGFDGFFLLAGLP